MTPGPATLPQAQLWRWRVRYPTVSALLPPQKLTLPQNRPHLQALTPSVHLERDTRLTCLMQEEKLGQAVPLWNPSWLALIRQRP